MKRVQNGYREQAFFSLAFGADTSWLCFVYGSAGILIV